MSPESFAKLTLLKKIIGQMSIAEKMAFVADVRSKLPPEALKTSDGNHSFSEENFLAVALLTLVADDREEFVRIGGFYGTGYRPNFDEAFITVRGRFLARIGKKRSAGCTT